MVCDVFFMVLVCVNDWMVLGVISCVRDLGMSFFYDLFVVGFDDVVFVYYVFFCFIMVSNLIVEMVEMLVKYIFNKVYGQVNNVQLYFEFFLVVWEFMVKYEG